ncbi:MAG: hypothetical protein HY909_09830 [Deltaproteobacteria bacterium]|nr:hypothetical protein [Deltaproteobacteria bacterium]
MSDAPLPTLEEAVLDESTLGALFTDLSALCAVHEVRLKGAPTAHSQEGAVTVDRALALLKTRAVRCAQVLYTHRGERWTDTVLALPEGWRLVRMRAP